MPDEIKCSVCGTNAISPHSVRRGITRCASCAAKARGIAPDVQRAGGKARAAQIAERERLAAGAHA